MRSTYILLGILGTFIVEFPSGTPLAEGTARIVVAKADLRPISALDSGNTRLAIVRSADVPEGALHELPAVEGAGPWLMNGKRANAPVCEADVALWALVTPMPTDLRVISLRNPARHPFAAGEKVDCLKISHCGERSTVVRNAEVFVSDGDKYDVSILVTAEQAHQLYLARSQSELMLTPVN